MSLLKSALIAASFAIVGTVSATAAQPYDSGRIESMRTYQWSAQKPVSAEARRARAEAVTQTRRAAPFSRMSLESQTW